MEDFDFEDETLSREFHIKELLARLPDEFDGPIYRGEEDLESVRNSESDTVAVVAEDQPMIFCVPREEFLKDGMKTNADNLFFRAVMP